MGTRAGTSSTHKAADLARWVVDNKVAANKEIATKPAADPYSRYMFNSMDVYN